MTFPSGTPGGFPGQGPQQPQQSYSGPAPASGRPAPSLPQILLLATGGLGVLNLFLAFANAFGGASFYERSLGWIPALLFVAGAIAVVGFLPGESKPGPWPAVLSVAVFLTFLFTMFQLGDLGAGGVLVLIFGLLQTGAAVGAYLFEAGIVKAPAPKPQAPYGQQHYGPPTGGFGQQPPPYGQQHPGPDSGANPSAQPTKFAQPVGQQQPMQQPTQQPTTYASQQGQFFQQPSQQQPEQGQQQNDQNTPGQSGS
ncbi:DUF5336 domain-containing protein [Saccharomonospora piscinae]|uniref:DUF5336 domain-containing protein n=1 Tax=Saccharomonospora piscinae TaxID=687388 RepID=UPI000467E365|nr:DUF5336 domain-containing protein [Saccharomonospora piscinae]